MTRTAVDFTDGKECAKINRFPVNIDGSGEGNLSNRIAGGKGTWRSTCGGKAGSWLGNSCSSGQVELRSMCEERREIEEKDEQVERER
jgi:hypothetical protein